MRHLRLHPVLIAAPLLMALALVLRAWHTTSEPLWLDEGYSLYAAEQGWHFLWHTVPRYETHPPFYYSLLRLWIGVAGSSVGGLRAFGILATVIAVGMTMLAAREAGRYARLEAWGATAVILAAGLLAALSPAIHAMAREVRPYPLMILTYSVAIWALLRLGRAAQEGERLPRRVLVAFFIAQAAMLWLHNLGVFYGAALTLGLALVVVRRDLPRRDWIALAVGHVVVALLYLPALAILVDQAPTWVSATWLKFSWDELPQRLQTVYASPVEITVWISVAALVLALAALLGDRRRARIAAALVVLALLPVILSVIVSATIAPVFIPRIMTALAVPAILVLAFAPAAPRKFWLLGVAVVPMLALQYLIWDLRDLASPPRQDWYGTADWLAARLEPGDEIWTYPNEGALPLQYALRDRGIAATVRPIPTPVPSIDVGGWYPTGSRGVVSLPRGRLRAIAASGGKIPTIWLLRLGANAYDVGDVFLHELWRDRRWVGRWESGPIDLIGLRRESLYPAERTALSAPRGGRAGAGGAR